MILPSYRQDKGHNYLCSKSECAALSLKIAWRPFQKLQLRSVFLGCKGAGFISKFNSYTKCPASSLCEWAYPAGRIFYMQLYGSSSASACFLQIFPFDPSQIHTVSPSNLPISIQFFCSDRTWRSKILATPPMLSVMGRPLEYVAFCESP